MHTECVRAAYKSCAWTATRKGTCQLCMQAQVISKESSLSCASLEAGTITHLSDLVIDAESEHHHERRQRVGHEQLRHHQADL
jgi:hypothetical protein